MAVLTLPTLDDGTPHYVFRTTLEGSDYEFSFRYGERRAGWVFDLTTLSGEALLRGQLVTIAQDFLIRVSSASGPPGKLFAANTAAPDSVPALARPGLRDLGPNGRCRLMYTELTT